MVTVLQGFVAICPLRCENGINVESKISLIKESQSSVASILQAYSPPKRKPGTVSPHGMQIIVVCMAGESQNGKGWST